MKIFDIKLVSYDKFAALTVDKQFLIQIPIILHSAYLHFFIQDWLFWWTGDLKIAWTQLTNNSS